MADSRLQWRPIIQNQPNVAGLMNGSGLSFQRAIDNATGILETYDKGQKDKDDQELARLLASTNDREKLSELVNSPDVKKLNLSQNGIEMLNAAQGNRVDWADTDSAIRSRDGNLQLAQNRDERAGARHDIVMREDGRMVSQRDWLEDNSSQFFDAERQALTNGTSFSNHIDRTESGGGSDQYDTLFGHQNRQNGVRVSQMTLGEASEFSNPNGQYAQSVNSEIGRIATPMGKFQIVGTTLRGIQENLGLPDDVPFSPAVQEQMGLYLAQQRVNGPRSRQGMRDGLRAEWEGFKDLSDAELDVMIDEIRSMPTVTRDSILAAAQNGLQRPTTQTSQTGFGGDGFTASMAASGQFTPQEILGQVNPLRSAAQQGDALIAQEDAEFTANLVTDITNSIVNTDDLTPGDTTEVQKRIEERLQNEDYGSFEATQIAQAAISDLKSNPVLMEALNRGETTEAQNLVIEEALNNSMQRFNQNFQSQDQYRLLSELPRYESDPIGTLEDELGIPNDSETRKDYNPEFLRNYVNKLVKEYKSQGFNVTPAIVAAAMRESFKVDPGEADESFWFDPDLTSNRIENRFDEDKVKQIVVQMTPERVQQFNRARSELLIIEANLESNSEKQIEIQSRLNRLPAQDSRRENLEKELQKLVQEAGTLSEKYRKTESDIPVNSTTDTTTVDTTPDVSSFDFVNPNFTPQSNSVNSQEEAAQAIEKYLNQINR
jgi:hypothetical protein